MSKNAIVTDFMREAVREKAAREMAALQQRADALGGVERARDALHAAGSDLAGAAPAVSAIAVDANVSAKLKKLRKLVEEAHLLATEIGDALGVENHQQTLATSRQSILDALKSAGLDASSVIATEGGDAQ
jgi:hypothetical protein